MTKGEHAKKKSNRKEGAVTSSKEGVTSKWPHSISFYCIGSNKKKVHAFGMKARK